MKKKIHKIWGVGLTLVLVTTMVLWAAPISAGTLSWSDETIPSASGKVLLAGDVTDLAVSADGEIIYASAGTSTIYRSSNGGESWTAITVVDGDSVVMNADLVAVAPDDENYIAVAGTANETVYISDDAGANWDTLVAVSFMTNIYDLDVSVAKGGNHFVGVAGDNSSTLAVVAYYEIGAVGAAWKDTTQGDMGSDWDNGNANDISARAVAFSPNFSSDEVMLAVSGDVTNDEVNFQIFSFDQKEWNDDAGFGTDYPVNLAQDDGVATSFDSASIALSPDYLGSDDSMRLAFVGITVQGGTSTELDTSSLQRVEDDSNKVMKDEKHFHSVDFDGTNLVAGRYNSNTVYRCADPLASSPSVSGTAGLKSPGGDSLVVAAFAGDDVIAGTSGDESAFAVSENNGKTFNDISLIDTDFDTLSDVAVSADGSNLYLVTANSTNMSLWRYASRWERVLCDPGSANDFIVRTAPDDMDVVYVADVGGTRIYYSANAGQEKWHTRISTYTIRDIAVETGGDVVYVAEDSVGGYVSKSTNTGFTWATKKASKLSAGISMLTSLGEDLLLAGSVDGKAAYSKDGNATWSKLDDGIDGAIVQVAAEGLEEGDLIWAATATAADDIYRWDWDDEEWDDEGDTAASYSAYGIALHQGVLYVLTANGTDSKLLRSLNPTAADPSWNTVDEVGDTYDATPSAMKVSVSDTTVKLWALDTTAPDVVSYKDTIALAGPTLIIPKTGHTVLMNPVTGEPLMVTFSWERPSTSVDGYDLAIAYDSGFDETVRSYTIGDDSSVVSYVADEPFDYGTTYHWRVRVDSATDPDVGDAGTYGPTRSPWSETRTFTVEELALPPAVEVAPPPEITVAVPPPPAITLPAPEIIIPTPEIVLPAPQVTLPPTPAPVAPIPGWALYLIIIIGAVLVIALIVLILRTRRPV